MVGGRLSPIPRAGSGRLTQQPHTRGAFGSTLSCDLGRVTEPSWPLVPMPFTTEAVTDALWRVSPQLPGGDDMPPPALGGGAGQGPAAFPQSPAVQGDIPTAQRDDSALTFTHSLGLISEMHGAPALSQGLEVLLEVPLRGCCHTVTGGGRGTQS